MSLATSWSVVMPSQVASCSCSPGSRPKLILDAGTPPSTKLLSTLAKSKEMVRTQTLTLTLP